MSESRDDSNRVNEGLPRGQVEQALQLEPGNVVAILGRDHRRLQVRRVHLGPQQIVLRTRPRLLVELHLVQVLLGLLQVLHGDREQSSLERRVVVRLLHLERDVGRGLRLSQRSDLAERLRRRARRADFSPRPEELRRLELQIPGIGRPERCVLEQGVEPASAAQS